MCGDRGGGDRGGGDRGSGRRGGGDRLGGDRGGGDRGGGGRVGRGCCLPLFTSFGKSQLVLLVIVADCSCSGLGTHRYVSSLGRGL